MLDLDLNNMLTIKSVNSLCDQLLAMPCHLFEELNDDRYWYYTSAYKTIATLYYTRPPRRVIATLVNAIAENEPFLRDILSAGFQYKEDPKIFKVLGREDEEGYYYPSSKFMFFTDALISSLLLRTVTKDERNKTATGKARLICSSILTEYRGEMHHLRYMTVQKPYDAPCRWLSICLPECHASHQVRAIIHYLAARYCTQVHRRYPDLTMPAPLKHLVEA